MNSLISIPMTNGVGGLGGTGSDTGSGSNGNVGLVLVYW
jgi:hypothetical protein